MQIENDNTNSSESETESNIEFSNMTETKYDVTCLRLYARYGHVLVTNKRKLIGSPSF